MPVDSAVTHEYPAIQWLSVPEFADRLGTSPASVRGALKDHRIVGVKESHDVGVKIPDVFLVPAHLANAAAPKPAPADGVIQEIILPSLRGTIIVLVDQGLSDDEQTEWLLSHHDDLGTTPIEALRRGNKSAVRRAAQLIDS
ncbi:hypothetical protein GCM10010401_21380 [Rarobacter faecitabidus]|uniref:Uncharacterized protein n=1 Tax=Rarobacter faecitabidus TaxID=13243 RepID=A0A542ZVG9_RARFA|nr:Rv2175c family DNA-binding protein [Rarobacter faecitabidus]TQL64342.1 hypothetical protein FB461_0844 [Rarobacter faecitabidus]